MKTEPCPMCGEQPDRMSVNGMRIIACLPCTAKIGPNGQHSVKAWNEFAVKMRKAIADDHAAQALAKAHQV